MPPLQEHAVGTIIGFDLTVSDAESIRDFYAAVVGWEPEPFDMGGYADYFMKAPGGDTMAGICHARGENVDLPPQWLTYIVDDDLETSLQRCAERGGMQVTGIKGAPGEQRYCVLQDPAGAYLALIELGKS